MGPRTALVAFSFAVVVGACGGDDDADDVGVLAETSSADESTEAAPTSETEQAARDTGATCEAPIFQPTYLPWLEPGESVSPPELAPAPSGGDGQLYAWFGPDGQYVVIGVSTLLITEEGGGPGEPTGVLLAGVEGELHIAPKENKLYIQWKTDDQACNDIGLTLVGPDDWQLERTREEILMIARSLQQSIAPAQN